MLSVSLNPYPEASAWVPILRICLRVSTHQCSEYDVFQPSFKRSLEFLPDCIGCDDGQGCHLVTVYNTASHMPDEVRCDVVEGSSHGVHGGFPFGDRAEHGPTEGW